MTNEYWLLKKTLGTWSKVSWWSEDEKDKADRSFESMLNSGYAIRLVKVETVKEQMLDEMVDDPSPNPLDDFKTEALREKFTEKASNFKANWESGWGKPSDSDNTHGMVGKVWLGNPTTKEKKRVAPDDVTAMMADGWVKAGPRTVL